MFPAEPFKVQSQRKPHYISRQGWICVPVTCWTSKSQTLCNMVKINGQLMPELIPAVVTHFHCKITAGTITENSDPDSLMSCRNLYQITGLDRDGAENMSTSQAVFLEQEHLSSLAVHPSLHPSILLRTSGRREGSVMNEQHWRTPKAAIFDQPPTSQHRQDNEKKTQNMSHPRSQNRERS